MSDTIASIDHDCLRAFADGNREDAQRLLKQVQQPKLLKDEKDGAGLVQWAANRGWLDVVKVLIEEYYFDPMCEDKQGKTLLHYACQGSHLNLVKYLITQCKCDPMCRNIHGDSPLYTASSHGQLEIIKYLINDCNCDPNDNKNRLCSTPLHIACFCGHIDVVCYLIEQCNCDPMFKRTDGWTPLHQACAGGHLNVVMYLITQRKCDPMCRDNKGNNSLHTASLFGQLEILKYLINDRNCDPMCKTKNGNNPFHIAVLKNYNDIINYLVSTGKFDPFEKRVFISPDFLSTDESTKHLYKKFSHLKSCTDIDSYVNIFLLGNSGVGKTTLTQVMKERAEGKVSFGKRFLVSNIELNTAGIIPHTLEHKELGNVTIHDLAGQPEYYSSHSAVIENILDGLPSAVFIILCKLSDDPPYRWLNLVRDLCSKDSSAQGSPPSTEKSTKHYLLTVASHKDAVKNVLRMECKKKLELNIEHFLNNTKNISNIGVVSLDCRMLGGEEFPEFKNHLSHACQSVRSCSSVFYNPDPQNRTYCNMLFRLFQSRNDICYKYDTLLDIINKCNDFYLPETNEKLHNALNFLHQTGLIMFIKSSRGSWIVAKKKCLLHEVNGKIFRIYQDKSSSNTGQF